MIASMTNNIATRINGMETCEMAIERAEDAIGQDIAQVIIQSRICDRLNGYEYMYIKISDLKSMIDEMMINEPARVLDRISESLEVDDS